jgi:O-acetyl-ADP-ribose deacetylase (regulator of RNase III)
MPIFIEKGDITKIVCDAIVNPANSYGYMGGGVAGVIKKVGGIQIENEAISKAPITVGHAIATTGGDLPCEFVIHAPTMEQPAMRIGINNVKLATKAALEFALNNNIKTIAIPGMGTGVGGVSLEDAAREMVNIAKKYEDKFKKIIFVGYSEELANAFNKYL